MAGLTSGIFTIYELIQKAIMETRWRFALLKISVWVVAEIAFSILGMDTLADYSEFVFERNVSVVRIQKLVTK
ncbi:hypothetical protein [Leptothoe spongobia]|uniref:Uncharacterized protein n=1 Tax=Leptothoe spongobia TAU-MAC 1115 TaxID=1967444 RepID=A0A947DDN6_9CYAN|nr:hypothetical protein [Leptothoe spongobia]MBT9315077.1 hypothetical protein [Leptothoe spongobia TAU-MAC 1115]